VPLFVLALAVPELAAGVRIGWRAVRGQSRWRESPNALKTRSRAAGSTGVRLNAAVTIKAT
jgi:cobalamin biosynthesis protein CobD/CbiB